MDWQLIGFHLELTDSDISAVDGDNRTVDEKRVGVLRRWKEKFAFHATYRILIKSLLACGRTSDAVNACKAIISGISVVRVAIRVSNLCRPHVNAKCLNDVRKLARGYVSNVSL